MNPNAANFMRLRQFARLALLLLASGLQAAPVRVTTWNLMPRELARTYGWSEKYRQTQILEAAEELKKLNPDVILLQSVADWKSCDQLAQALKPEEYKVVVVSSFRDKFTQNISQQQVAILSKSKAYISWSEAWQGGAAPAAPGGFAFAAIRVDGKNTGFFSIQLGNESTILTDTLGPPQSPSEDPSQQFMEQIATLRNWTTNRLLAYVVAGDFSTSSNGVVFDSEKTLLRLEQAGFQNVMASLSPATRTAAMENGRRQNAAMDYFFMEGSVKFFNPQISQSALVEHWAASCDFLLETPKRPTIHIAALVTPPTTSEVPATKTNNQLAASVPAAAATPTVSSVLGQFEWPARIMAACLALFVVAGILKVRANQLRAVKVLPRAKAKLTLPMSKAHQIVISQSSGTSVTGSASGPVVHIAVGGAVPQHSQIERPQTEPQPKIDSAVREGVIANLSRWMKEKLVRRLVSDRAELLATQQAATLKILAVDERLSKVEKQIAARNQEYEERIDALTKELAVAQEENREMIRAKIALVKAEMARERAKAEQYFK